MCIQKLNNLKVKDESGKFFKDLNFLSQGQILYKGWGLKLCRQIYRKNIKILKFKKFKGYTHSVYESIIAWFWPNFIKVHI